MPSDAGADSEFQTIDFYQSCSDHRCDFVSTEGEVTRGAPTWHPMDVGVALEGDPASIMTVDESAGIPTVSVECYRIEVLGSWDPSVKVNLRVEIEHDDSLENFEKVFPLATGDWQVQDLEVMAPSTEGTVWFSLEKRGRGEMVLYSLEVEGEFSCSGEAIEVDIQE